MKLEARLVRMTENQKRTKAGINKTRKEKKKRKKKVKTEVKSEGGGGSWEGVM